MNRVRLPAVALLVAACANNVLPSPSASPFAVFQDSEIRFEYPTNWTVAVYPGHRRLRPIAYLSTAPMHDPCVRTAVSTSCDGLPVDSLGPDGILVMWMWLFPPGLVHRPEGEDVDIGGRQAVTVQEPPSGTCSAAGYEAVHVVVADEQAGGYLEMIACLNGPTTDVGRAQVQAMLDSVVWTAQ